MPSTPSLAECKHPNSQSAKGLPTVTLAARRTPSRCRRQNCSAPGRPAWLPGRRKARAARCLPAPSCGRSSRAASPSTSPPRKSGGPPSLLMACCATSFGPGLRTLHVVIPAYSHSVEQCSSVPLILFGVVGGLRAKTVLNSNPQTYGPDKLQTKHRPHLMGRLMRRIDTDCAAWGRRAAEQFEYLSAGVPSAFAWLMVFRLSGDTMSLPAAKLFFSFSCSSLIFCCSFWMPRNCLYLTSSLHARERILDRLSIDYICKAILYVNLYRGTALLRRGTSCRKRPGK